MKIEVGESLISTWLAHIKGCQIIQNNWKASPNWKMHHEQEASDILSKTLPYFNKYFAAKSKNPSLSEFLKQAECDSIGISFAGSKMQVHAVDVAFHTGGLGYTHNLEKVIEKTVRNMLCALVFLNVTDGDIYFASPLIGQKNYDEIYNGLIDIQKIVDSYTGLNFRLHLIGNDDFASDILDSVCALKNVVADTNELWLRSYQLLDICHKTYTTNKTNSKMKIGELARTAFKTLIEAGKVSDKEISQLCDKNECKKIFNVNYPVLVKDSATYDKARYYSVPNRVITHNGASYRLTREWYETKNRKQLEKWIGSH